MTDAEVLQRLGLTDAPPVVQCSVLGHAWSAWQVVRYEERMPGGVDGYNRRRCARCESTEARSWWAW